MNSITPHIATTEKIEGFPKIFPGVQEVLMMPVVSDFGPNTPKIIDSRELLATYTGGRGLKRSDNISLKLAYALSRYSNIMVSRVVNSELTPGIVVGATITKVYVKGDNIYSDKQGNTPYSVKGTDGFLLTYEGSLAENILKFEVVKAYDPGKGRGQLVIKDLVNEYKLDFSLNIDDEDGYGHSKYVETLNTAIKNFKFTFLTDVQVAKGKIEFGESGYERGGR